MRTNFSLLIFIICTLFCVTVLSAQSLNSSKQFADNSETAFVDKEVNTVNKWDYFIYPVPASTELNVKITRGQVNISQIIVTNEGGDEVISLSGHSSSKMKVDINDLKPGKYFIRIITDDYATPKMKRFYVSQ